MKEFSIYSLYVVEIKEGGEIHYYICGRNKNNMYEEFFTKRMITATDIINVESLSDYYPILLRCYYDAGKALLIEKMIDKNSILRKYIEINCKASLEEGKELEKSNGVIDDNAILERATVNLFANEIDRIELVFIDMDELRIDSLIYHLKDNKWLAKMLKKNQRLLYMSTNDIMQYVETSSFFQEKRLEYEQKIVKWLIEQVLKFNHQWLIFEDNFTEGELIILSSSCDLIFRKSLEDTLLAIGINKEAIEEGIEKNANLWRDFLMETAFDNEYDPFKEQFNRNKDIKPLVPVDPEHKESWLKLRKYEYYQAHKDSVDKYGVVDSDMTLTSGEVSMLKTYLEQKNKERMDQIEEYREEIRNAKGEARARRK